MDPSGLEPWLALNSVAGLTGSHWRRLLTAFGTPAQILAAPRQSLARVIDTRLADAIAGCADSPATQAALAWAALPGHDVLTLDDPRYPQLLNESPDPPPLLFAIGRIELISRPMLAVVGSRNATAQGMRNAEAFARVLAAHGLCIVSGMALGIDAAAHRGALQEAGGSVAVLGCGIDVVYPRSNARLYQALAAEGLLLSEFPLGTAPIAYNFPRRNRIIAGLSRGCLVVEAALASGSLTTARAAVDMGRDVFAIPGSIHSPLSKGCHHLIKQGAKLVDDVADVLSELGIAQQERGRADSKPALGGDASAVLAALGHDPCDFDTLAERTGLDVQRLSAILTELELAARVTKTANGNFQRLD